MVVVAQPARSHPRGAPSPAGAAGPSFTSQATVGGRCVGGIVVCAHLTLLALDEAALHTPHQGGRAAAPGDKGVPAALVDLAGEGVEGEEDKRGGEAGEQERLSRDYQRANGVVLPE